MGTCNQTHVAVVFEHVLYRLLNNIIAYVPGCSSYRLSRHRGVYGCVAYGRTCCQWK